ncbi:hypothetical protein EDB86DRAFT_2837727 [Lactarius hatsudake]|nr:hypothetical protein EDB86DRAFT_2837727 [Lactarius hatsudake]
MSLSSMFTSTWNGAINVLPGSHRGPVHILGLGHRWSSREPLGWLHLLTAMKAKRRGPCRVLGKGGDLTITRDVEVTYSGGDQFAEDMSKEKGDVLKGGFGRQLEVRRMVQILVADSTLRQESQDEGANGNTLSYQNQGTIDGNVRVIKHEAVEAGPGTSSSGPFWCSHIEHQPNIALKLQIELHEAFDTKTSLQSLAHTLQRTGYTMKMPAPEQIEQDHAKFQTLIDTHYSPF